MSRRLTLLSSATSSRAGAWRKSVMAQFLQGRSHSRVLRRQRIERIRSPRRLEAAELLLARHGAQCERAEGEAVRLERMRRAAESVGVAGGEGVAQFLQHPRRFFEEGLHQLLHEV